MVHCESDCQMDVCQFIILKMRKKISQIKDSFLELIKKPTNSTDSSSAEQTDQQASFYQRFLEGGHWLSCSIKRVQRVPRVVFQRSYAVKVRRTQVYVVEVRCDLGNYEVKRRYSEFQQFYEGCQRLGKITVVFPPRTVLKPGWCEGVTSQRVLQLNNLLDQISASNTIGLKVQLFSFLHLYTHYQRLGLTPKETSPIVTDQSLLQEVMRLNENPVNMLDGLRKIYQCLSERKRRIGYELARQILTGVEEEEGLLGIVLSSGNQLIVSEGLHLLNWLVSAETNTQNEIFRRVLAKCQPERMVLQQQEMRNHGEVGTEYFKLLRHYLQGRQEEDLHLVASLYQDYYKFQIQYVRWVKFNSMDSA